MVSVVPHFWQTYNKGMLVGGVRATFCNCMPSLAPHSGQSRAAGGLEPYITSTTIRDRCGGDG
jgi:hypothetical protein